MLDTCSHTNSDTSSRTDNHIDSRAGSHTDGHAGNHGHDPDRHQEAGASPSPAAGAVQCYYAQVYGQDGQRYGVAGAMGCYWLPVAASCLLQPAVGDTVLISLCLDDGYILAVLTQAAGRPAEVRLPDASCLTAGAGALTIRAGRGVRIEAGSALQVQAQAASFAFDVLGVQARSLQASGETYRSAWRDRQEFIQYQVTLTGRTEQRSAARVTRVDGHDEHSAGSQRIIVQRDWRVRAGHIDMHADKRASLDAPQIQLG